MCLLERVRDWDPTQITCLAISHRDPSHPLRDGSALQAVCGIEYAAQAIAVHRGLLAGIRERPTIGVIGAVRNVILGVERLDDIAGELEIRATKLFEQGESCVYTFSIYDGERTLLSGRASVMTLPETNGIRPAGINEGQTSTP